MDTHDGGFVIGVGGSGAMLMQTLLHLSAAGLLPDRTGGLLGFLVDSDQGNGSGTVAADLANLYKRCRELKRGTTNLFKTRVTLEGPWTPVSDPEVATLGTIFGYTDLRASQSAEADLIDLMFDPQEREETIFKGFRGRPAVGSAILGKMVNLKTGEWGALRKKIADASQAGQGAVPVVLAGSVFGGSGAAGMPTVCRLLEKELTLSMKNARVGLLLFLPYFRYEVVPGEPMQADPETFASRTKESLKYYDEGGFIDICHGVYAVGDEQRALQPVSSLGGRQQNNAPHFVELIAGLGVIRFMMGEGLDHSLSLAARANAETLTWADLPTNTERAEQIAKLRSMTLFAVVFRYVFYEVLKRELDSSRGGKYTHAVLRRHLTGVSPEKAAADLLLVNQYVESFLNWLVKLSFPMGLSGYRPGLIKLDVVAIPENGGWRLKKQGLPGRGSEFDEGQLRELFLHSTGLKFPSVRDLWRKAENDVNDNDASGSGQLLRALYDACVLL